MTEAQRVPPPPTIAARLTRLSVSDFGPVERAEIDLTSDVTFLMGPQSSGKTYLATLAYGLSRGAPNMLINGFIGALAAHLREQGVFGSVSPEALAEVARQGGNELGSKLESEPSVRVIPNLLPSYFGVTQLQQLVRHRAVKSEIGATYSIDDQPILSMHMTIARNGEVTAKVSTSAGAFDALLRVAKPQIVVMPAGGWSAQFGGLGILGAKYIPAERIIPTQVLSSYLDLIIRMGQPSVLGQTSGLRMPLFRQTLLDYVQDIGQAIASRLEKPRVIRLLDFGDLLLESSQLRFKDLRRDAVIDMSQAASGVAQVAGIALVAETEPLPATLFVEEPELNLHADAQLRVADYLAKVSERTRLVVTTHSQYVATMLAIDNAKGRVRSLRGYYLNPNSDSSEEVSIDRKTGNMALPASIERALESIGEAAADLDKLPE